MACSSTPEKTDNELRRAAETNTALGRQYMERGDYEIALDKLKREAEKGGQRRTVKAGINEAHAAANHGVRDGGNNGLLL